MTALLRMIAGLIWWSLGFAALYALHGWGCAAGWDRQLLGGVGMQRVALVALWLVFVGGGLAILWRLRGPSHDLFGRAGELLAWVGLVATIVGGWPILTVAACV